MPSEPAASFVTPVVETTSEVVSPRPDGLPSEVVSVANVAATGVRPKTGTRNVALVGPVPKIGNVPPGAVSVTTVMPAGVVVMPATVAPAAIPAP